MEEDNKIEDIFVRFIRNEIMKTYDGNGDIDSCISNLDSSWRLDSRPGHFTPGVKTNDTDWIGGWVSLRSLLDVEETRRICLASENRENITWLPGL
jgi:hypothetical protein